MTQWLRPLGSSWSGTMSSAIVDSGVFGGGESRQQASHTEIFTLFVGAFCHFIFQSGLCHPLGCLQSHRAVVLVLIEGWQTPWSTDPRTNDENTDPRNSDSIGAVRGPKQRGEHQPSKLWWGGETVPPLEPRTNTERQHPTRGAKLEPEQTTVAIQCSDLRPDSGTPGLLRWDVFIQWRNTSSAETATCASCHETRTWPGEPATLLSTV